MPLPPSLSRKLRETLGKDAGGDLVTWLEEQRAESAQFRADLAEFRQEIGGRIAALETTFSRRLDAIEKLVIERTAKVESDLMKWSFVFWVGAVAAIFALAGVLRP
jgi:hypothetical protein